MSLTHLKDDLARINAELSNRGLPRMDVPETVTVVAEEALGSADAQGAVRAGLALH